MMVPPAAQRVQRPVSVMSVLFSGILVVMSCIVAFGAMISTQTAIAEPSWQATPSLQDTRRLLQDSMPKVFPRENSQDEVVRDEPVRESDGNSRYPSPELTPSFLATPNTGYPVTYQPPSSTPSQVTDGTSTPIGSTVKDNTAPKVSGGLDTSPVITAPSETTSDTTPPTLLSGSSTPTVYQNTGQYQQLPITSSLAGAPPVYPSNGVVAQQAQAPIPGYTFPTVPAVKEDVERFGAGSGQRNSDQTGGTSREKQDTTQSVVSTDIGFAQAGNTVPVIAGVIESAVPPTESEDSFDRVSYSDDHLSSDTTTAGAPALAGTSDELQALAPDSDLMQPTSVLTSPIDMGSFLQQPTYQPATGSGVYQTTLQVTPYQPVLQTTGSTSSTTYQPPAQGGGGTTSTTYQPQVQSTGTTTSTAYQQPVQHSPSTNTPSTYQPPGQTVSTPTIPDSSNWHPAATQGTGVEQTPPSFSVPVVGDADQEPEQPDYRLTADDALNDLPEEPVRYDPDARDPDVDGASVADDTDPQLAGSWTYPAGAAGYRGSGADVVGADAEDDSSTPDVGMNDAVTSEDLGVSVEASTGQSDTQLRGSGLFPRDGSTGTEVVYKGGDPDGESDPQQTDSDGMGGTTQRGENEVWGTDDGVRLDGPRATGSGGVAWDGGADLDGTGGEGDGVLGSDDTPVGYSVADGGDDDDDEDPTITVTTNAHVLDTGDIGWDSDSGGGVEGDGGDGGSAQQGEDESDQSDEEEEEQEEPEAEPDEPDELDEEFAENDDEEDSSVLGGVLEEDKPADEATEDELAGLPHQGSGSSSGGSVGRGTGVLPVVTRQAPPEYDGVVGSELVNSVEQPPPFSTDPELHEPDTGSEKERVVGGDSIPPADEDTQEDTAEDSTSNDALEQDNQQDGGDSGVEVNLRGGGTEELEDEDPPAVYTGGDTDGISTQDTDDISTQDTDDISTQGADDSVASHLVARGGEEEEEDEQDTDTLGAGSAVGGVWRMLLTLVASSALLLAAVVAAWKQLQPRLQSLAGFQPIPSPTRGGWPGRFGPGDSRGPSRGGTPGAGQLPSLKPSPSWDATSWNGWEGGEEDEDRDSIR